MHRVFAKAGIFALAFLVMLVFAAMAGLGVSLSTASLPLPSAAPAPAEIAGASPAEIVASRFPSADTTSPTQAMTFSTASVMPVEYWEKFDLHALSGTATADPPWPVSTEAQPVSTEARPAATETTQAPSSEPTGESAAIGETVKPEPSKAQVASALPRRVTSRSSNVLNDAQIASIKQRLKLTAEQEQMWPAVEAALRKIVYTKNAMNPQGHAAQSSGSPIAYIDPSSAELRQLKSAALPLIMRLNDDQKREVKMLAYVMGLESMASQF